MNNPSRSTEPEFSAFTINTASKPITTPSRVVQKKKPIIWYYVGGAFAFLAFLGWIMKAPELPANPLVSDWMRADFRDRSEYLKKNAKYLREDNEQRDIKWKTETARKSELDLLRSKQLNYSDYRLNYGVDDIDKQCSKAGDKIKMVDLLKQYESQKEKEVLALQLKERAKDLPSVEQHYAEMEASQKRIRESEEREAKALRDSQITSYEYHSIGGIKTPKDVAELLGVEGVETASSAKMKVLSYRGSNGVYVTVTFRYDDKSREWQYSSKAQSGLRN